MARCFVSIQLIITKTSFLRNFFWFQVHPSGIVTVPRGSKGPRSLYLRRYGNSFGFTLRHFIVYPPDSISVSISLKTFYFFYTCQTSNYTYDTTHLYKPKTNERDDLTSTCQTKKAFFNEHWQQYGNYLLNNMFFYQNFNKQECDFFAQLT